MFVLKLVIHKPAGISPLLTTSNFLTSEEALRVHRQWLETCQRLDWELSEAVMVDFDSEATTVLQASTPSA